MTTTDNNSPGDDGQTSFLEALREAQAGDTIAFNIPGDGPHIIVTPMGGYPFITADNLTIDGYTQPGASPNTNPILGGNNAVLKIVLDSSGTDTAPGELLQHRSTRLIFPGFGDTEDAILPVVGARNVTIRGLSFLSRYAKDETDDPNVYCVAFVNTDASGTTPIPATGGHVSGCWFGLHPDGQTLKGGRASVATFRSGSNPDYAYASGLVIGTDGDGVNDRAEFNIHAAMSLAIHLQVPDVKISGNYVNVLPDGNSFVDVNAVALAIGAVVNPDNPEPQTVEFLENANCRNVIIGTDGDGVADADERNIVANVSYSETMEFWREADRVVVAGNHFGVGVDGVTRSPVSTSEQPDFIRLSRTPSSVRIGPNGDGVSDDLEVNLIVGVKGDRFVAPGNGAAGDISEITYRRNVIIDCGFSALPFPGGETAIQNYYPEVVADVAQAKPVLTSLSGGILRGRFGAPNTANYGHSILDVYTIDPGALRNTTYFPALMVHPSRWLGSFPDNGAGDLDPDPNEFEFDLSAAGLTDATYLTVTATYSKESGAQNVGTSVSSPPANPIAARPTLFMTLTPGIDIRLWWAAPENAFQVEINGVVNDRLGWFPPGGETHFDGNNYLSIPYDPFTEQQFYRLRSL
ncbi:MAG TPA: hypothetical protein VNO52_05700 [Methylomirabilota bacterium]|nr:hypothetical protein [Methylomirabilota bacterium]